MKKYLVGAIGGIASMLVFKLVYRKGVRDGIKFSEGLVELISEVDEES